MRRLEESGRWGLVALPACPACSSLPFPALPCPSQPHGSVSWSRACTRGQPSSTRGAREEPPQPRHLQPVRGHPPAPSIHIPDHPHSSEHSPEHPHSLEHPCRSSVPCQSRTSLPASSTPPAPGTPAVQRASGSPGSSWQHLYSPQHLWQHPWKHPCSPGHP